MRKIYLFQGFNNTPANFSSTELVYENADTAIAFMSELTNNGIGFILKTFDITESEGLLNDGPIKIQTTVFKSHNRIEPAF